MFDEDDRRLVQVASIAIAIGSAGNASPCRALLWLAGEVIGGRLAARLFIPVRMRTVDTTRASSDESLSAWCGMAKRVEAERKRDMLNWSLPAVASTWHVHVNDLLQFAESASIHDAVRAALLELAQPYRGPLPAALAPASAGAAELPDPQRRLAALRALGGTVTKLNGKWRFTKIGELTTSEKAAGRPRSDKKTIGIDLAKAAEAEAKEGPKRPPASAFPT